MKFQNCLGAIGLFAGLSILSCSANAITNIESQRLAKTEDGTKGTASLTLDGREGNSDKIAFGGELKLIHSTNQHEWITIASRDYAEVDEEVNTDKTFLHVRHLHKHGANIGHETFVQHEDDEFRLLSSRTLLGGGMRYTLTPKDSHQANSVGAGLFYEDEDYIGLGETNDEETVRLNLYWSYKNKFRDHATYTSTLYFQPSLEDLNDEKGLWQNALTVSVTSTISLSLKWDVVHDTNPPDDVVATETTYKTVLIYNF